MRVQRQPEGRQAWGSATFLSLLRYTDPNRMNEPNQQNKSNLSRTASRAFYFVKWSEKKIHRARERARKRDRDRGERRQEDGKKIDGSMKIRIRARTI